MDRNHGCIASAYCGQRNVADVCMEISCRFLSPTLTDLMNYSMSITMCMFYPESTNIGLFLLLYHNLQPSLLFIGILPHVPYLWVFVEHSSDSNDCWKISDTSEPYSLDIIKKWHSNTGYPELWIWWWVRMPLFTCFLSRTCFTVTGLYTFASVQQ